LIASGKFRRQFTVAGLYRHARPPHENDGMPRRSDCGQVKLFPKVFEYIYQE
jgi:hypothetical protein